MTGKDCRKTNRNIDERRQRVKLLLEVDEYPKHELLVQLLLSLQMLRRDLGQTGMFTRCAGPEHNSTNNRRNKHLLSIPILHTVG